VVAKDTTARPVTNDAPARPDEQPVESAPVRPGNTVAAPAPVSDKKVASLPVIQDGLNMDVVRRIAEKSVSVNLDTAAAKAEIQAARTDIDALKWSLISAARGKQSVTRMNELLESSLTPAQLAEANRRALVWINQRKSRQ
jgi:hypothetical protein